MRPTSKDDQPVYDNITLAWWCNSVNSLVTLPPLLVGCYVQSNALRGCHTMIHKRLLASFPNWSIILWAMRGRRTFSLRSHVGIFLFPSIVSIWEKVVKIHIYYWKSILFSFVEFWAFLRKRVLQIPPLGFNKHFVNTLLTVYWCHNHSMHHQRNACIIYLQFLHSTKQTFNNYVMGF